MNSIIWTVLFVINSLIVIFTILAMPLHVLILGLGEVRKLITERGIV